MSDITLVRSLYGDLSTDSDGNYLFDDNIISSWLDISHGNPFRAAAIACRALAADQNYLLKHVRTDDLAINGPAVAAEFRQLADDLDARADESDADDDNSFAIVGFQRNCPRRPEGTLWPVGGWGCA